MVRCWGIVRPTIFDEPFDEIIEIAHIAVICRGTSDRDRLFNSGLPLKFVHVIEVYQLVRKGVVVGKDAGG